MKRKILIIFINILLLFAFTACNKREIDKLIILNAVGIDLTEDGSLVVTIQFLNPNSFGNNPKDVPPVIVGSQEGRTIQECFRKFSSILTEELFFHHFNVLVIGEDLARKGIEPYINFFSINQETLHGYPIIITHNCSAEEVLKMPSNQVIVPSISIWKKIQSSESYYGLSKYYSTDNVISDIRSKGIDLTLPTIEAFGNPDDFGDMEKTNDLYPENYVAIGPLAVFDRDKLIGFLTETQSIAYNSFSNKILSTVIVVVKGDGNMVTLEVSNIKTKIKYKRVNNKPSFIVTVSVESSVVSDNSGNTRQDLEYIEDIKRRTEYEIKKAYDDLFDHSKTLGADIMGFGRDIYRYDYSLWEEIKDVFYVDFFPELKIEVIPKCTKIDVKP